VYTCSFLVFIIYRLTDIDHTLDLMDFDGSDDLDINEFFEVWCKLFSLCNKMEFHYIHIEGVILFLVSDSYITFECLEVTILMLKNP
jgi:hypothetical protein